MWCRADLLMTALRSAPVFFFYDRQSPGRLFLRQPRVVSPSVWDAFDQCVCSLITMPGLPVAVGDRSSLISGIEP